MTTEDRIHDAITAAVGEERRLRDQLAEGRITTQAEHERIAELEVQLDRLWDLLRRRQAERAAGQDPDDARPRSVEQVEGYEG